MSGSILKIGCVFKKMDLLADHFKYSVIVADVAGCLATVYINTNARYLNLPIGLQGSQYPINSADYNFLDHDSFIDCSRVIEFDKSKLNEYLTKSPGHHLGFIQSITVPKAIVILKNSKNFGERY